ncbi:MAG: flagellar assembly protein FliW [Fimbriimonadia bacterium]|nr:flagellar assembly protein FliW [Fimbriimonadia bacterium]
MELSTSRFGTITIEENNIYHFPEGLVGFRSLKRFALIQHKEDSPFLWLQSVENGSFALLLTDPWSFNHDYAFELSDEEADALCLNEQTSKWVYTIVSIPPGKPHAMTANLLAPIVLNEEQRIGRQVVLNDDQYTTRHLILNEMWRSVQQSQAAG